MTSQPPHYDQAGRPKLPGERVARYRWSRMLMFAVTWLASCELHEQALLDSVTIATEGFSPQAAYEARCARCHSQAHPKAPHEVLFELIGSNAVHDSLKSGLMREYVEGLDDGQIRSLADHLGRSSKASVPVLACPAGSAIKASAQQPLQGFGLTLESTRYVSPDVGELTTEQVRRLRLKWAFAYSGATRARSQPSYYAGSILVGSQDGSVYALDLGTGCAHWTFKASAEVRNAISVATELDPPRALFGDIAGNVYAIDATNGHLIWKVRADDHPATTITGSPRLYKDLLYVPLSSTEWASAADPSYPCCTFRGGVVAVDIYTGSIRWTSYAIPETPRPSGGDGESGGTRFHPAGAPVWNSPTIDEQRGLLYVGTGEAYTSPAAETSDAIVAMDLSTGALDWHFQALAGDAWNMACYIGGGGNCPEENGPDLDFGASPILVTLSGGRGLLLAGQKSGMVYALDPDRAGALVWQRKVGRGGFFGGVHWGMAADGTRLFAPIADTGVSDRLAGVAVPGLSALDTASGNLLWFAPAPDVCAEADKPACDPGISAAVTATSGVVFAGAFDGHLRAHDAGTGELIWDYDTNRSFQTVSGELAHGGSIAADGPVVVRGHVLVNSGYLSSGRMGGNVLLVFAPSEIAGG